MGIYTTAIEQLYVAYFNRPADAAGLAYWENVVTHANGSTAAVSAAFAASAEYKAAYAGMDAYHVVAQVYQNLFGHAPDTAGLNFWGQALLNNQMTVDNVVTQIAAGAQGTDQVAYNSKVSAATQFSAALNTTALQLGYSGDAANAAAKAWMSTITDDASLQAAIAQSALTAAVTTIVTPKPAPMTFSLTSGMDTFVGGAGNDVVTGTSTDGTASLTAFDSIDGGTGNNTLKLIDLHTGGTFSPAATGATVANFQNVSIQSTEDVNVDTTGFTGTTNLNITAAGNDAVGSTVKAAGTTNVTLATATTGATTITGGAAVAVVASAATAGNVGISGAALTNVSIKGGAAVTVNNTDSTGAAGKGATLTAVTLDGITGTGAFAATLSGTALTNVTVKNVAQTAGSDLLVNINNTTAKHTLNLTVDTAGKVGATAGAAPVAVASIGDSVATTINVTAAGKSDIALYAAKATALTVGGAAAITVDATNAAILTSVDASSSTGAVTLTGLSNTVATVNGGSGNDTITLNTATTAADATNNIAQLDATMSTGNGNNHLTVNTAGTGNTTVNAGAGNDVISVTARSSGKLVVNMGAGNDTFTSTAPINGTDVIDAGAGTDTLALKLVGSANIGAFMNFDVFDTAAMAKELDVDILASKNNVSEFVASGDVGAGAQLDNIGAGIGFRATGDMGTTNTLVLNQKTAGALTVTLDADSTSTTAVNPTHMNVDATNAKALTAVFAADSAYATTASLQTINLEGDAATSLNVVSGGTNATNVLVYNDAHAKLASMTISGASNLDITGLTNATNLTSVDASAMTGKLAVDLGVLATGAASVTLGAAADTVKVEATASNAMGFDSIVGIQKAAAVAVSTAAADATASAAAIAAADSLVITGATIQADATGAPLFSVKNGVMTFSGAGPTTLAQAITEADAATTAAGHSVVFEYLGNSYVFVQGDAAAGTVSANDIVVKLVGTTGVVDLAVDPANAGHLFLV